MIQLRFKSDQFFAAGLIGVISGVCHVDRWTGRAVPSRIDWDESSWCADACETGEHVEPTEAQRMEIAQAVTESLGYVCDAPFVSCVELRQSNVPAL